METSPKIKRFIRMNYGKEAEAEFSKYRSSFNEPISGTYREVANALISYFKTLGKLNLVEMVKEWRSSIGLSISNLQPNQNVRWLN